MLSLIRLRTRLLNSRRPPENGSPDPLQTCARDRTGGGPIYYSRKRLGRDVRQTRRLCPNPRRVPSRNSRFAHSGRDVTRSVFGITTTTVVTRSSRTARVSHAPHRCHDVRSPRPYILCAFRSVRRPVPLPPGLCVVTDPVFSTPRRERRPSRTRTSAAAGISRHVVGTARERSSLTRRACV